MKSLGNLQIAIDAIGNSKNDIGVISDAILGLNTANKVTILSTSLLSAEQQIGILTAQGLSQKEAEAAITTATLSTTQKTATVSTMGLSAAFKGLWVTMKAHPIMTLIGVVTIATSVISAFKRSQEELRQSTEDAANVIKPLNKYHNSCDIY